MISWLTVEINPPQLDTEIIVKRSSQMKFTKGIYSSIEFFDSEQHSEESMLISLESRGFDQWSEVI